MSYVYFIQAGDERGAIKIGYSVSVEKRIESLRTGNHLPLRMLAAVDLGTDAPGIERELHEAFADLRMEGEWFANSARIQRLIDAVRALRHCEYRCSWCDCRFVDFGGAVAAMTSRHRQIMASLSIPTWEEAHRRIAAGDARVVSEDPSWAGQECGDASRTGSPCEGQLVLVAEHAISAHRLRIALDEEKR